MLLFPNIWDHRPINKVIFGYIPVDEHIPFDREALTSSSKKSKNNNNKKKISFVNRQYWRDVSNEMRDKVTWFKYLHIQKKIIRQKNWPNFLTG